MHNDLHSQSVRDKAGKSAVDYRKMPTHPVDDRDRPAWGKGPDGRPVDISADEVFAEAFDQWRAESCMHDRTGIVQWTNMGGQTCYNWFCAKCGFKLSTNIPHALARAHGIEDCALDSLASRSRVYVGKREDSLEELKRDAAERAQPGRREEYSEYLRSTHWQALRSKVMARAKGLCEGCLGQPAEEVHHLTYAHKGAEFAFELIALCEGCHERLHSEGAE